MSIKAKVFLGLLMVVGISAGFQSASYHKQAKKGMIKVTILYPNAEGKTFDLEYYKTRHMPMVASLLGDSLKMYEIDKGISGRTPNDPTPYFAIGYLYFDRLSAYQNSFRAHAEKIRADIPNYTNTQAVIQISEVIQ